MSLKSFIYSISPSSLTNIYERAEDSPLTYRLAKGIFWSAFGTFLSRSLMICASVLVARFLGAKVYGELGMIRSTVGLFGVLGGFGLGVTATKYVAQFYQTDPPRAGRIIGLSGLLAILTGSIMAFSLFVLAPWLTQHTINAPHLVSVVQICSLIVFLEALNGSQTGALSGFEAFKSIAYVNILVGVLSFPILLLGAYWGALSGAVWALVINLCINCLCNNLALRKELKKHGITASYINFNKEYDILWKFSLPAVLSSTLVGPIDWICSAILVNQPKGYSEMGIFSVANQWYIMVLFLPVLIGKVVLPIFSEQLGINRHEQSLRMLILSIKVNVFIVAPIALCVCFASSQIMALYGKEFSNGWGTLTIMMLTSVIMSGQIPLAQLIAASGRMWLGFAMNGSWAIVYICSTLLLVKHGAFGLAIAKSISYFVLFVLVGVYAIFSLQLNKRPLNDEND